MGIGIIFLKCLVLLGYLVQISCALCEIGTGEGVIILDIAESSQNETTQYTQPRSLPIKGDLSEIKLSIIADTENIFALDGKQLKLTKPLDRDLKDISFIQLQIRCTINATKAQRTIPVTVRVIDINDNAPKFVNLPYEISISELVPIGTTVFRELQAIDDDSSVNSLVEYFIVPGNGSKNDGYDTFEINLPYQGYITSRQSLDYERNIKFEVKVIAVDRASKLSHRLTSTTTLTVHVLDADDQDPAFVYEGCHLVGGACVNPEYSADILSGKVVGVLNIKPGNIAAIDRDSLNSSIIYSFAGGERDWYRNYIKINPRTGVIQQTKLIDRSEINNFSVVIKAEELSESRRFATARLLISVRSSNESPPVIKVNSHIGYVDEQTPAGTVVTTKENGHVGLHLQVSDDDLIHDDPTPKYHFEFTTDKFGINTDGYLIVQDPNLDRDQPGSEKFVFQAFVRDIKGKTASAPVTITVYLNDINDNIPDLKPIAPLTIMPSVEPTVLTNMEALDGDAGENSKIIYSLYHVSNNGQSKFRVNETSGMVESIAPLEPGQQYSLTLQAADRGGRASHRILDVYIMPTGRAARPSFSRQVYDVQVNEGAATGTVVLSLQGDFPENGDVTYSIEEGDPMGMFMLSPLSGVLSIRQRLDRERVPSYVLRLRAEDRSGHATSTIVNVEVTDINDKNPEFVGQPYIFHVDEGLPSVALGRVKAIDADEGPNGIVYYSILDRDSSLTVDVATGEIRTKRVLDFESGATQYVIVTAHDGAQEPRIGTATVTIIINDMPDEVPVFNRRQYEGSVPENMANMDILQVARRSKWPPKNYLQRIMDRNHVASTFGISGVRIGHYHAVNTVYGKTMASLTNTISALAAIRPNAHDPDGYKQITYIIRDGPVNRFAIDPGTGVIRTIWPLDYEETNYYTLIIGTRENFHNTLDATCTVKVSILDRNDVAPLFTSIPPPLSLMDVIRTGVVVATVVATDADGSPPNNLVRYSLNANSRASNHFNIDHDTGTISVKGDLSRESSSELNIEVKAYDLGSPQLTATATIPVRIEHTVTRVPELGIAFPDASYTVEVDENALGNSVIKSLPIINKPRSINAIQCEIDHGNELGHFFVKINEKGDCDLSTKGQKIDYETHPFYQLIIKVNSKQVLVDPERATTEVNIKVRDVNDNRPAFVYKEPMHKLIGKRYVTSVTRDALALTPFTKVAATDNDSGKFGKIEYSILPESDTGGYFVIDRGTGLISNSRTFEKLDANSSKMEITLMARDNADSFLQGLNATTNLTVNLISDEHRLVLVIRDSAPEKVAEHKGKFTEMLQESTSLVISIEKIESRKFINDSKIFADNSGTDLWFNVIDPISLSIITVYNESLSGLLLNEEQKNLLYGMSSVLEMNVEAVRSPFVAIPADPIRPTAQFRTEEDMDVFQAALIALACIIAVLGTVGIIYVCFLWARFTAYREKLQRMSITPRYESVLVEPNFKHYETQVLQMNVQQDDDSSSSYEDHHYDYKRNLDNVSYVTRDTGDGSTLALGNTSFTESDSFEGGDSALNSSPRIQGRVTFGDTMSPAHNPVYHSSDENAGSPVEHYTTPARMRGYHTSISPVATTTEL